MRDAGRESDLADARRPLVLVEGTVPIGVQEEMLRYWRGVGRPDAC